MKEQKIIKDYLERKSCGQLTGDALEQSALAFCQYAEVLYALSKRKK